MDTELVAVENASEQYKTIKLVNLPYSLDCERLASGMKDPKPIEEITLGDVEIFSISDLASLKLKDYTFALLVGLHEKGIIKLKDEDFSKISGSQLIVNTYGIETQGLTLPGIVQQLYLNGVTNNLALAKAVSQVIQAGLHYSKIDLLDTSLNIKYNGLSPLIVQQLEKQFITKLEELQSETIYLPEETVMKIENLANLLSLKLAGFLTTEPPTTSALWPLMHKLESMPLRIFIQKAFTSQDDFVQFMRASNGRQVSKKIPGLNDNGLETLRNFVAEIFKANNNEF